MRLTDARQLDWGAAREAAQLIIRQCEDAAFSAPENLISHQRYIKLVCEQMNAIVRALCITPPTSGKE